MCDLRNCLNTGKHYRIKFPDKEPIEMCDFHTDDFCKQYVIAELEN